MNIDQEIMRTEVQPAWKVLSWGRNLIPVFFLFLQHIEDEKQEYINVVVFHFVYKSKSELSNTFMMTRILEF